MMKKLSEGMKVLVYGAWCLVLLVVALLVKAIKGLGLLIVTALALISLAGDKVVALVKKDRKQ